MIATLYVTRDCNLRCEYCYAGRKRSERMAYATAERAVNIALRNSSLIAGIRFFGGEPLLEWDLVKHVTAYAIGEARKQKLLPSFSISTNGTLLNPENLTFFEEHDFAVGVSIDGPPTVHNRNRRTRDGTDSFEQVRASYEALRERDIRHSVELVLDPTTLSELASSVQYLVEELKVRFIIVSLNVFNDWGTDFRSVLTEQYARIADLYLDRFSSDEPFEIDSINNKINVILRGGYDTGRVCRLGRTEITVVPDGRIYACLRLVGWDEEGTTVIGNVESGIDSERVESMYAASRAAPVRCRNCLNKRICVNWCPSTNLVLTGSLCNPGDALCEYETALISVAQNLMTRLDMDRYRRRYRDYLPRPECGPCSSKGVYQIGDRNSTSTAGKGVGDG